jgi:6-pyruvoyltetrahydropterin/6-carboxytetrahydropterin synthase
MDFGGLKPFKEWIKTTFDHRLLIAEDDPMKEKLIGLGLDGLGQPLIVKHIGCEAFAKMIYDELKQYLRSTHKLFGYGGNIEIRRVEVREHAGNSAYYYEAREPFDVTNQI